MKFLLVEILIWLIAASILGLIVGWLFKALFAKRKFNSAKSHWDNEYAALKSTSTQQIAELNESVTSFEADNTTLQSKVGSLSAMVKSMETALLKANAENKALSTTVSSQQLTINEIRIESENLIKKQSELQMELNTLEKSNEQEFDSLNRPKNDSTIKDASKRKHSEASAPSNDSNNKTSGSSSVTHLPHLLSSVGDNDSTSDIDQKIKNLNDQRDRLNREREELFNQEQHFASQLTRGDDTEAYLDQTIRIDEDLTATIQSDTSELHTAAADPADNTSRTHDESLQLSAADVLEEAHNKPKSLWDKFKSSMHTPADKPKA